MTEEINLIGGSNRNNVDQKLNGAKKASATHG